MMDRATFLFRLSGALDTTADDLAAVKEEVDRILDVIEGSLAWSRLRHCSHRLDVHARSLRSLAERSRRHGEDDGPGKGPSQ